LEVAGGALKRADPAAVAVYLTSRGLTNETYYAAAKATRALGINNIDSAARVCHSPSTVGLKDTIGVAAATCSLQDVLESDLIVLWGTNPANNQPVFTKYLHKAKVAGAKVAVVNPYLEPGLDKYWVPSVVESAVFGTRICDLHIPVGVGGDIAFAHAVVKELDRRGLVDEAFAGAHTEGLAELRTRLAALELDDLLAQARIGIDDLHAFCDVYGSARSAVIVWSMGITQHSFGAEAVRAIVNVGLARGNVGRNGAGLMPIRGHSGVQGGAEMGAYATAFPGGRSIDGRGAAEMSDAWGFEVPSTPGLTAPEVVDAAHRGDLEVLWMSGGNFLDVMPDPPMVREALERVPLRIHQDVVVTSQMLVDGDDVVLLPVRTRYEQEGGGTSTTTERRIAFSPEIPRQVGEARSEWRLFADVAKAARPDLAPVLSWPTNQALREEIARVVPAYAGIEKLSETGDAVQWGGRHLCEDGDFPTPDGKGRFSVVELPNTEIPEGMFRVTTRRGKQFNSILWGDFDPLTGTERDTVFMDSVDAADLGVTEGDRVRLWSDTGELGGRVHLVDLPPRTLQVTWPEANVLLASRSDKRDSSAGIPDYQAIVRVEKA
jgi:molybdopterin-dependent oxidoreductase alpha subunit